MNKIKNIINYLQIVLLSTLTILAISLFLAFVVYSKDKEGNETDGTMGQYQVNDNAGLNKKERITELEKYLSETSTKVNKKLVELESRIEKLESTRKMASEPGHANK